MTKEEEQLTVKKKLIKIQNELSVPKGKFNSYANFKYRSLEDILEKVKPLLKEQELLMFIEDEIIHIGGRFWIKATVSVHGNYWSGVEDVVTVSAYAREAESKVKMDDAQVTGMASTYARKYALNGLFLIDDTQDPDDLEPEVKKSKTKEDEPEKITKENRKGDEVLASRLRIKIKNTVFMEDLQELKQEIADAGKVLNKEQFESVIAEAKKKKEQLQGVEISDEELNNLDFSK